MLGRRAYICYTRVDKSAASRLRRSIRRLANVAATSDAAGDKSLRPDLGPLLIKRLDSAPLDGATRFDIDASDWLILVCSPNAVTPAMAEAAMVFKESGRAHRILPVITDGEPGASRITGLAHRECLPRPLLFAADAGGALTDQPVTPAFIDLRPDGPTLAHATAEIAARISGVPAALFRTNDRRRRQRRGLVAGAAAAASLAAMALAPALHRDMEAFGRTEAARAAGLTAHHALDQGRASDAVRTLTDHFPRNFDFASPSYPVPEEAISALNRAALETRELANLQAPATDIARLVPSQGGTVIAIAPDAGAHVVDLGAGEATRIYAPGLNAASRVSDDGATLWTARFGAEAHNGDGDAYAPLIFENVDLSNGEGTMTTAVQSLPPRGGATAISPGGARFAVDIGPGHTDRTLIAVFSRESQTLAGVATLPADRAQVTFLGPDRLLLVTNPPNIYGAAPGLYLWNLAEDRPRVLRAPGRTPVCPGGHNAARRAIAAEIAAGRLPAADWAAAEDGSEVALMLPALGGGSCILRWDSETGRQIAPLTTRSTLQSLEFVVAGGPYAAFSSDGDLRLMTTHGETRLKDCGDAARHFTGRGEPLVLCTGQDGATLHHGYSGQRFWRGTAPPTVTAATYDAHGQRLIMASDTGRIAIWDAAPRGYPVARARTEVTLAQPDKDHVAVLAEDAPPVLFDLEGRSVAEVDPDLMARLGPVGQPELLALAATGDAAPVETCGALTAEGVVHRSDSPTGRRSAIETAEGVAVYDRESCLPVLRLTTRTTGAGPMLVSDDLLWAPLPGEVSIFPLGIPLKTALESLHSRNPAKSGH